MHSSLPEAFWLMVSEWGALWGRGHSSLLLREEASMASHLSAPDPTCWLFLLAPSHGHDGTGEGW